MAAANYKEIALIAQQRREKAIPSEYLLPSNTLSKLSNDVTIVPQTSGHFTHDEIEIVESEAEDILQKISEKIWTSVEVTKAFCKAAAVAQQLTNCLTEILFYEALERAQELDNLLTTTGELAGPLHGLPISLKDCFVTPPYPSSVGMASYANESTSGLDEAVLVSMLRSLGAIIYVKTNVPVAMMMMETDNNVFGATRNPHHLGTSSGGSSGGESALIAMRGSPLGIGTDIGGSIRIPSAFCGLYGLKPSFGRYPTLGTRSGIPGQEFVLSINGPMSRSLQSLILYSSTILSPTSAPWTLDPKVLPIPWRSTSQILPTGRPLRLALAGPSDGLCTAHPPIDRALSMTKAALEAAGHEVIDWAYAPEHAEMVKLTLAAFLDFGGPAIMQQLAPHGEPVFPCMGGYETASQAAATVGTGLGPNRMREMNLQRAALAKGHLDRWHTARIDGLIMPVSPWAACRSGVTNMPDKRAMYVGFTAWANLLDLPSCTFPVTKVDAALDKPRGSGFVPWNETDANIQADYDGEFYAGAPVALQCVGERLGEEKVLEVVGLVRDALVAMDRVRR